MFHPINELNWKQTFDHKEQSTLRVSFSSPSTYPSYNSTFLQINGGYLLTFSCTTHATRFCNNTSQPPLLRKIVETWIALGTIQILKVNLYETNNTVPHVLQQLPVWNLVSRNRLGTKKSFSFIICLSLQPPFL